MGCARIVITGGHEPRSKKVNTLFTTFGSLCFKIHSALCSLQRTHRLFWQLNQRSHARYTRYMQASIAHRRLLVGIDDTDNLDSRGTGFRAREFGRQLMEEDLATVRGISRHQLYVHPDIPYTSHNSALCLDIDWRGGELARLVEMCRAYLAQYSAEGSDAGFSIAMYDDVPDEVVAFGRQAKDTVLTKAQAAQLAKNSNIHLEGVTGDHGGIIGAIACVGLRKSGHDGRFVWVKGVRDLDGITTAGQLLGETGIDVLQNRSHEPLELSDADRIDVAPWPRPVLLNDKAVLLIERVEGTHAGCEWKIVPREGTRHY